MMSRIKIKKPYQKWLFGGFGFHNSEATMMPIMEEDFKNECVLKCFREVSPTFSRVYGGFADWSQEAMDHFADYYDQTFRRSGTTLYMVPGRMPMPTADFDLEAYCEKTAEKLEYLINVRKCTKIRYFCVTNELSVGNTYAYLANHLDLFVKLHDGLFRAFARHGLDVGLLATDCSGEANFPQIEWACEHMDELTADYCTHLYLRKYQPGDLEAYDYCRELFAALSFRACCKQKRYILGEYGINDRDKRMFDPMKAMINDVSYAVAHPENDGIYAVALAEMSLAVLTSGTFASAFWTLFDYPDPFIKEDGDTREEKARYEVARFSGHGLQIRYNKNGLIRWRGADDGNGARASFYTMGYLAKLFRKGSRVLDCEWDDEMLRAGAVINQDGTFSICLICWADEARTVEIDAECQADKPLRRYDFCADAVPYNRFCDLQSYSQTVSCDGKMTLTLPPRSVTFLSTDYVDRVPSQIENVRVEEKRLVWDACTDSDHCYYRVYASSTPDFAPCLENQICSTVAEFTKIDDPDLFYRVVSVDQYGNVGV